MLTSKFAGFLETLANDEGMTCEVGDALYKFFAFLPTQEISQLSNMEVIDSLMFANRLEGILRIVSKKPSKARSGQGRDGFVVVIVTDQTCRDMIASKSNVLSLCGSRFKVKMRPIVPDPERGSKKRPRTPEKEVIYITLKIYLDLVKQIHRWLII